LNALAQFRNWGEGPAALCPPGGSRSGIGAHNISGLLKVITGCHSFLYDIERCGLGAMFLNMGFHYLVILWGYSSMYIAVRLFCIVPHSKKILMQPILTTLQQLDRSNYARG